MKRNSLARRIVLISSALAVASGLAACGGKKKTKIAFVTNGPSDFWVYAQAGIAEAEKELGDVDAIYKVGESGKQRKMIDDLLVSGVQGVAFSPTQPKEQIDHIKGWAKKAKIMTVDSDAPGSDRLLYIGTDNVAAGRECGKLVKEAMPDGGQIMVFVGIKDQLNAVERFAGLTEELRGSNIEIIDLRTDQMSAEIARRNAQDTLVKYPDIAGMVGLWSYNAPQILAAVENAGKLGQVKIVGFDEDPTTLKAIAAGEIYATVCQQPYEFGYQSIKMLHRLVIKGEKVEDMKDVPESRQIMIPTITVKKDEALAYLEKCNAWKAEMK